LSCAGAGNDRALMVSLNLNPRNTWLSVSYRRCLSDNRTTAGRTDALH
jgi:hypothetical protein